MQRARRIVTEAKESCRRNLEITCYGDHITLLFWSGSRGNKIAVQLVDGETRVTTTGETSPAWDGSSIPFLENIKCFILPCQRATEARGQGV